MEQIITTTEGLHGFLRCVGDVFSNESNVPSTTYRLCHLGQTLVLMYVYTNPVLFRRGQ